MSSSKMNLILAWFSSFLIFFTLSSNKIDNGLNGYYQEFMDLAKQECNKISPPSQFSITFSLLSGDNVGECTTYLVRRKIEIDKNYWNNSSIETKRQLMFHELTHCVLDMDHVNSESNYMNPYLVELPAEELYRQVKQNMATYCNNRLD